MSETVEQEAARLAEMKHLPQREYQIAAALRDRDERIMDADHEWALWFEKWTATIDTYSSLLEKERTIVAGMKSTCEGHKLEQTRRRGAAEAERDAALAERDRYVNLHAEEQSLRYREMARAEAAESQLKSARELLERWNEAARSRRVQDA